MPTAAQVVAQWLVTRGTCVFPAQGSTANWPVTVSYMPPYAASGSGTTPLKNYVTVYDSGDLLLGRDMTGDRLQLKKPNVQVRVRAADYLAGEARCRRIEADLAELGKDAPDTVTVAGTPVVVENAMLTVAATHLGRDPDQGNTEQFTINGRLTYGE
jgi:hypothetical protein